MWFIPHYLRSIRSFRKSRIINYTLFENTEDELEQLLALACILYHY